MNVYDELAKRGADKAVVFFSGGNDEGGAYRIELLKDGKKIGDLQPYDAPATDEALVEALQAPMEFQYGSFCGEFSVQGTVTWDVKTRKSKMDDEVEYNEDSYNDESDY